MHSRGLYIQTEKVMQINILMVWPDGKEERIEGVSPAEDLVNALEPDYRAYRAEIQRLRDEHPLFEEGFDIAENAYHDFLAEAMTTAELLRDIDPVSYFMVVSKLDAALRIPDDGTASFLLYNGQRILSILEEPVLAQIQLRNIFEVGFANLERGTQRQRYEELRKHYPKITKWYFPMRCLPAENGDFPYGNVVEYSVDSLLMLRLLELELYFRQDKKRIARCEHCWGYFIPGTKKETHFCDRVREVKIETDAGGNEKRIELTCKQLGWKAQRRINNLKDNVLALCDELRHRMESRFERSRDNRDSENRNTRFPIDIKIYGNWSDDASKARVEYLEDKITAEEFLRRIDIFGELLNVEPTEKQNSGESLWQKKVRSNINFDPAKAYFDILHLELKPDGDNADAKWTLITAEDREKADRGDYKSLVEWLAELPPPEDKRRKKTE